MKAARIAGRALVPAILLAGLIAGLVLLIRPARAAVTYYVSTTGSALNTGTSGSRWSLAHACSHPAALQPGDTILVAGGSYTDDPYTCNLNGTSINRITIKAEDIWDPPIIATGGDDQGPGMRVTGQYANYFWFVVREATGESRISAQSGSFPTDIDRGEGWVIEGDNNTMVRIFVHNQKIGFYAGVQAGVGGPDNMELIGCVSALNGWKGLDRVHTHGFYQKNEGGGLTTQYFRQGIAWGNFEHGVQAFGGDANSTIKNMQWLGGAYFNNSAPCYGAAGQRAENFVVSNAAAEPDLITVDDVWFYQPNTGHASVLNTTLGASGGNARNITFTNNKLYGGTIGLEILRWNGFDIQNNLIHARSSADWRVLINQSAYTGTPTLTKTLDNNSYYDELTWAQIFQQGASGYSTIAAWRTATGFDTNSTLTASGPPAAVSVEQLTGYPGHANIRVWNPSLAATASVNLTGVGLADGEGYKIRNAQDPFGADVAAGTYSAATPTISLDMTSTTVLALDGAGGGCTTPASTMRELGAFIIGPSGVAGTPTPTPTVTNTPTNTSTNTPTPTATQTPTGAFNSPTPTPTITASNNGAEFEAESGEITAPMAAGADALACGAQMVSSNVVDDGTVMYRFAVPATALYNVWVRVLANTGSDDSVFTSIDGESDAARIFDFCEGCWSPSWQWVLLTDRSLGPAGTIRQPTLATGGHTLRFRGREVGSRLDRIVVTRDLSYVPGGCVPPTPTPAAAESTTTHVDLRCGRRVRISHAYTNPPPHRLPCPTPSQ